MGVKLDAQGTEKFCNLDMRMGGIPVASPRFGPRLKHTHLGHSGKIIMFLFLFFSFWLLANFCEKEKLFFSFSLLILRKAGSHQASGT